MRQPTIHQMREKKNHRGKVKEVERLQYDKRNLNRPIKQCIIVYLFYLTLI
jgi:hypothetical protein